jgi:hypothetical protein
MTGQFLNAFVSMLCVFAESSWSFGMAHDQIEAPAQVAGAVVRVSYERAAGQTAGSD